MVVFGRVKHSRLSSGRLLTVLLFIICYFIFSPAEAQTQRGIASYYAKSWTGRTTASGERLHHDSMTCAHRTLPFGTLLRVTSTKTGMQVVVRVNDRGPYVRGRIVDLSWGAARQLGIMQQGIASVEVEVVRADVVIPFLPLTPTPPAPIPLKVETAGALVL